MGASKHKYIQKNIQQLNACRSSGPTIVILWIDKFSFIELQANKGWWAKNNKPNIAQKFQAMKISSPKLNQSLNGIKSWSPAQKIGLGSGWATQKQKV